MTYSCSKPADGIDAQLAEVWRGNTFQGYGLAVDGKLVNQQISTTLITEVAQCATMQVVLVITSEMKRNAVKINLENKS